MMKLSQLIIVLSSLRTVAAVAKLEIASPLTALTIWDDPELMENPPTFRSRFLPKFRAGLLAEAEAAESVAAQMESKRARISVDREDWAQQVAALDQRSKVQTAKAMERAYDEAVAKYEDLQSGNQGSHGNGKSSKFQFVGVVNPDQSADPITWYARPKPSTARWSVRLVHVNKRAIIKDLFNRGKIDLFARYENSGRMVKDSGQRLVKAEYIVRERSWKNLWNFSPKHFITDSSGMYWRERRLRPGLYTDGDRVYEASYRYFDGRNGMHMVSDLGSYLSKNKNKKEKVVQQIREGTPDVVLED